MFNETAALRTAVFAILENRRWRVLSNPQSGRGLKFHHTLSMSWGDAIKNETNATNTYDFIQYFSG